MANEKCPKCGPHHGKEALDRAAPPSTLGSVPPPKRGGFSGGEAQGSLVFNPDSDKDCRIKSLERQLAASEARENNSTSMARKLDQENTELRKDSVPRSRYRAVEQEAHDARAKILDIQDAAKAEIDRLTEEKAALERQLEEAKAATRAARAHMHTDGRCVEIAITERDAALAESRKRGEEVVMLRGVIDDFFNYEGGAVDPRQDDYLMERAVDALINTSATAQQFVERIRREAVEEAVERLLGKSKCNSFFFDRQEIRAAILGEKEKG